jgi:hypothetical protein
MLVKSLSASNQQDVGSFFVNRKQTPAKESQRLLFLLPVSTLSDLDLKTFQQILSAK